MTLSGVHRWKLSMFRVSWLISKIFRLYQCRPKFVYISGQHCIIKNIHSSAFHLNSSQRFSVGLKSELCTGQSRSSTPDSMSLWPTLCALMCGSLNFSYKAGSMTLSKMSWYAQVLRTSFTRTKRHSHLWWLVRGEGTLPTSKSSDRIMLP